MILTLLDVDQLHDGTHEQSLADGRGGGRSGSEAAGSDADQHGNNTPPQRPREQTSQLFHFDHFVEPLIAPGGLGLGFGREISGFSGADVVVVVQFNVLWQLPQSRVVGMCPICLAVAAMPL